MKIFRFKTKKDIAVSVLLILLIVVFLFSAYKLGENLIIGRTEQRAFDDLREIVDKAEKTEETETEHEMLPGYAGLYQQNKDFAGWIRVDGTKIDYPVMCAAGDANYYLHRAFDGSDAASGTPFLGVGCEVDSDCIIIHGHNMKNKTMFGTLDYYIDKKFCEEYPVIQFDSLYEHREYRVFAAVQCEVVAEGKSGFKYYECGGSLDDEKYAELVQWLSDKSFYDMGCRPSDHSQILILSTCSYQSEVGRFIVAAYRVK